MHHFGWSSELGDAAAEDAPMPFPMAPMPSSMPEPGPAPPHMPFAPPAATWAPGIATVQESDAAARRGAGIGVLIAAAGAGLGAWAGGWCGAGAGLVLVGALRNAVRAKQLWPSALPVDREEAAKSATMAVFGTALGGYLIYKAYQQQG